MKSQTSRKDLDVQYIVSALMRNEAYSAIARRETDRLNRSVTRNQIAAIKRDIRLGRVDITGQKYESPVYRTFVYDVDEDNGGVPVFTGHPRRQYDRFMVVSDLHSPYMDIEFAGRSIMVAKHLGITDVIVGGDVFHGEQKSPWRKNKGALTKVTDFRQDLDIISDYLWGLVDAGVDNIEIIRGNHDDWLISDWEGTIDFRTIMRMLDGGLQKYITVSNYDRIEVTDGSGEAWTIPHQKGYSPYVGKVGDELVNQFRTNIITTHQHINGTSQSRYGQNVIVDIGGLHDPEKTAYLGLKTSSGRKPGQGFATVSERGVATCWTRDDRLTDWSVILERD